MATNKDQKKPDLLKRLLNRIPVDIERLIASHGISLNKNAKPEDFTNKAQVNETPNPVDLENKEVNEVERALKELREEIKETESAINRICKVGDWVPNLLIMKAQNLVNALEAEKAMSKPDPKWLPMSCAPKCGSPITVKQSTNERHKIFKANWFLNKWYSLYEEGGNQEVYPEFWLEGSKEEPKIDMKKERVEPVSIWIEIGSEWKSIDGKVVTIDFVKNNLVVWTYEFNDREQITFSTKKEIFIKDFKELNGNIIRNPARES